MLERLLFIICLHQGLDDIFPWVWRVRDYVSNGLAHIASYVEPHFDEMDSNSLACLCVVGYALLHMLMYWRFLAISMSDDQQNVMIDAFSKD